MSSWEEELCIQRAVYQYVKNQTRCDWFIDVDGTLCPAYTPSRGFFYCPHIPKFEYDEEKYKLYERHSFKVRADKHPLIIDCAP